MANKGARHSALRILDANGNRAREGLRVCEEVLRLGVGAPSRFRRVRSLRQSLNRQLRRLPVRSEELLRARDVRHDPGRRLPPTRVGSLGQVLLINLQRTKEALRVLEECVRLLAPREVKGFQRLRFRTYDVERDLLLRMATLRHSRSRRSRHA